MKFTRTVLIGLIIAMVTLAGFSMVDKKENAVGKERQIINLKNNKKTVLIFSSYGGGGHISAARALHEYLEGSYDVNTVYIFDQVLKTLDPLKILTFGFCTGEQFYNFCLRKKFTAVINMFYKSARVLYSLEKNLCRKIIWRYLSENRPSVVISVVPLINDAIRDACDKLGIPFVLVPTDLDPDSFIYNLEKPSSNMKIAVPFRDSKILKYFDTPSIAREQLVITDFPIKPSFFEKKNNAQIKKDFSIPENKKVILVLMGAAGADALYNYTATLNQLDFPVHLLICLGRSEWMREKINALPLAPHVTISTIGFTDRIADLLAVADLCITKAGTVSVCETMHMNVPMILDNMSTPLAWEAFNFDFITHNKFGQVCNSFDQLNSMVTAMLGSSEHYALWKNNLENFPKKEFGHTIKILIDQLANKHMPQALSFN